MIVLDANILIRAVLGRRVRHLVESYAPRGVRFFAPDVCFDDAEKYLPGLLMKRGRPHADVPAVLEYLRNVISPVHGDLYGAFEDEARERLLGRDEGDWPILATALGWLAPSGARTRTSSEQASPSGLQIVSRSSSKFGLKQSSQSNSESR